MIETLFPTSIDKIRKEIPLHKGVNSIILSNEEILKKIFSKINQEAISQEKNIFNAGFTILVRNKQAKEAISARYFNFHIPVFTIYEAKVKKIKLTKFLFK